jgi:hypothetical protein
MSVDDILPVAQDKNLEVSHGSCFSHPKSDLSKSWHLYLQNESRMESHRVPVAHVCNPSYSVGRDQENLSLKPAWANSSQDPISKKNPSHKHLVEWLKV